MDILSIAQIAADLTDHIGSVSVTDGVNTVGHLNSNFLGGHDVFNGLQHTGSTEANIFGGHNDFNNLHELTGYTQPNVFGGVNHFDALGNLDASTSNNIFGGQNLSNHGHAAAYTSSTLNGDLKIHSATTGNILGQADFSKRFFS